MTNKNLSCLSGTEAVISVTSRFTGPQQGRRHGKVTGDTFGQDQGSKAVRSIDLIYERDGRLVGKVEG